MIASIQNHQSHSSIKKNLDKPAEACYLIPMADPTAAPAPAAKNNPPRRCAKCATPCKEKEFKTDKGEFTPYCSSCRGRFPSLSSARLLISKTRKPRR